LLLRLEVEVSDALLRSPSLGLSLELLLLKDHQVLRLSLQGALLLQVNFILLVDQGTLGLQFL